MNKCAIKPVIKYRIWLLIFVSADIVAPSNDLSCANLQIVNRESWSAKLAHSNSKILKTPVHKVIVAHTVTDQCSDLATCSRIMRNMQLFHMKLGWKDIGYNFAIGDDGRAYEGVGWRQEGIHTKGHNSISMGIAFIGNFMKTTPSNKMLEAGKRLIICGIKKGYIAINRELHGGRDATCTASPGDRLYDIIKTWPMFKAGPLPSYKC